MTDYYGELAGSDDPAVVDGWRHTLEQWLRFEVVCRGLAVDDEHRVVDLGCGTGQLFPFLGDKREGHYFGVDRLENSIERARASFGDESFLCADLEDSRVDDAGPFDFAVAIGTLVDGGENSLETGRISQLRAIMGRLDELGRLGWALVVLDEERLAKDPIRRLEPSLKGATRREIAALLEDFDLDAVVDSRSLPTDLFVICRRDQNSAQIARRLKGDEAHRAVLDRATSDGDGIDDADRAWLWLVSERLERARKVIAEIPDSHRRKPLLVKRLRLMETD